MKTKITQPNIFSIDVFIFRENFENKNFSDLIYVSPEETINDIHQNSSNIDNKEITNEFEITD